METAMYDRTFWHNPQSSLPADVTAVAFTKHMLIYIQGGTPCDRTVIS